MPTTWYNSKIKKIEEAAPNVRRFWLEKPENFQFEAGQFLTVDLPIGEKRLQRWRSYSIANAPDEEFLELCIVRSAAGNGTKYLFENLEIGSEIKFKGPDGAFVLPPNLEKQIVLIGTGTGIAPFRSMILDLKNKGKLATAKVHLIFGCRREEDILYRSEFEGLAAELPDFQYDVVLSRQPSWAGWQGHLHQIYLEKYASPRADVEFFVCGWTRMIDEAVANLLLGIGFDRSQVHFELYG